MGSLSSSRVVVALSNDHARELLYQLFSCAAKLQGFGISDIFLHDNVRRRHWFTIVGTVRIVGDRDKRSVQRHPDKGSLLSCIRDDIGRNSLGRHSGADWSHSHTRIGSELEVVGVELFQTLLRTYDQDHLGDVGSDLQAEAG